MKLILNISSKNLYSLKLFNYLLIKSFFKNNNLQYYFKLLLKKKKLNFFSLLKSPHVNKTAQSQFETRTFNRTIIFKNSVSKIILILLIIKSIYSGSFPEIKLTILFDYSINNTYSNKFPIIENEKILYLLKKLDIKGNVLLTKT
jgi:ribosomal protein S10|uniref:Ribosomal protein S10 n=1 Tax=Sundstroemia setigera TaxID=3005 RepID=A0A8A6KGW7_9STRA|nr:ribosomal protein S10 [Rhizosolenia setigera]QTI82370.1 ribosomal protein S10 [Rhizosolenia setigera]WAQ70041.1 ribosomal protein S10 [Rhizosolenia setigera]WAQ70257.1 ribosomal protein S10 [Rhizosolenia setigera]